MIADASAKCGLRWHPDGATPRLYYSEYTPVNVRLLAYDLEQAKKKLIMNFDGLNMQPSFSADGNTVVVCSSRAGSSQLYLGAFDAALKQWTFTRITTNENNNLSPHLCTNGDIIFCSDTQGFRPQIYCYKAADGSIERLTDGGYCASPAVCEKRGLIAFIKMINNTPQLYTLNMKTKEQQQLTFNAGDKDEPTWSPCGNYIAYSVGTTQSTRIAVRNVVTKEDYFITAAHERCSSPAWSSGVVA